MTENHETLPFRRMYFADMTFDAPVKGPFENVNVNGKGVEARESWRNAFEKSLDGDRMFL